MNKEQKKAIYDVLENYYKGKEKGEKTDLYLENLGDAFPEIRKKAIRLIKNRNTFKKGQNVTIGMMADPSFILRGTVIKANSMFITVRAENGQELDFYTSSLNQKGNRDKDIFDTLFLRKFV